MRLTRKQLRNRIARLEEVLKHANARGESNADYWRQRYEEQTETINQLAEDHSKLHPSGHITSVGTRTTFFCDRCHATWPCEPFRVATGKEFAPIKLQLREETP